MPSIHVVRRDSETFEVNVACEPKTVHVVTLKNEYYQKLTGAKIAPEELIARSFEFLLERESNTAILRHFELSLIGRYFPEFEERIAERL